MYSCGGSQNNWKNGTWAFWVYFCLPALLSPTRLLLGLGRAGSRGVRRDGSKITKFTHSQSPEERWLSQIPSFSTYPLQLHLPSAGPAAAWLFFKHKRDSLPISGCFANASWAPSLASATQPCGAARTQVLCTTWTFFKPLYPRQNCQQVEKALRFQEKVPDLTTCQRQFKLLQKIVSLWENIRAWLYGGSIKGH